MRDMSARIGILVTFLIFAQPLSVADAADASWMAAMQELAISFRSLEESVATGDLEQLSLLSQAIMKHSSSLTIALREGVAGIEAHSHQLSDLARGLNSIVANRDLPQARRQLEVIRRTCVSCHATYRDFDKLVGFYPARGNTIVAQVKVLTADNVERTDHSDVVVFLDGIKADPTAPTDQKNPVVSQQNRSFSPRVLPIVKGTTVEFPNDDSILHNVFSLSKPRRFDLDVYRPGTSKSVTFNKTGLVRLHCNIHPDMACSILVLNNPYFALSNRQGLCVITGIPDGTYFLRTWNELGGGSRQRVSLQKESAVRLPLRVEEQRRSLMHTNKHGLPYPKRRKY